MPLLQALTACFHVSASSLRQIFKCGAEILNFVGLFFRLVSQSLLLASQEPCSLNAVHMWFENNL